MLAVAGESARDFSAINAVTALYRIARALTSRAGRVRRKEAAFVIADARFAEARPVVAPTPSPPPRARRDATRRDDLPPALPRTSSPPRRSGLVWSGLVALAPRRAPERRVASRRVSPRSPRFRRALTPVPIRPRWRGERRSLRTLPGASLRPALAFNPRPRRLSTPLLTPFNSTPTSVASYGPSTLRRSSSAKPRARSQSSTSPGSRATSAPAARSLPREGWAPAATSTT